MSRFTKTLCVLTLVTLTLGLLFDTGVINVDNVPELYVVFPMGACLFGLFLICRLLGKEVAAFDAEQRAHNEPAAEANEPEHAYDGEIHSPGHA